MTTPKKRLDDNQVGGDHYSKMNITPWEFLESCLTPEEFRGYLKGEAIVYIAREMSKAGPVDIGKARHVLQKLEEVYPAPKKEEPEHPPQTAVSVTMGDLTLVDRKILEEVIRQRRGTSLPLPDNEPQCINCGCGPALYEQCTIEGCRKEHGLTPYPHATVRTPMGRCVFLSDFNGKCSRGTYCECAVPAAASATKPQTPPAQG